MKRLNNLETSKNPEEDAAEAPEKDVEDAQEKPEEISGDAGSFDAVEDVGELHARIHVLENQCSTLQKKLNARPIVYQTPGSARRRAASLARSTSLMGVVREIVEQLLRNFTEELLKRDAFLWVFYGHLCILYVIAASCYAQTGVTSTTVDVDLHSKQALRGISPG